MYLGGPHLNQLIDSGGNQLFLDDIFAWVFANLNKVCPIISHHGKLSEISFHHSQMASS